MIHVFEERVILDEPIEEWPLCDCLISFHSKGFPLDKAVQYAELRKPMLINDLYMQYSIMDRLVTFSKLDSYSYTARYVSFIFVMTWLHIQ